MNKLILKDLIVFEKGLAFSTEGVKDSHGFEVSTPAGFNDEDAVDLLMQNRVKLVNLHGTDSVSPQRLEQIRGVLGNRGITCVG